MFYSGGMSIRELLEHAHTRGFTCWVRMHPYANGFTVAVQLRQAAYQRPIFEKHFPSDHDRMGAVDIVACEMLEYWNGSLERGRTG
jgi:hypothetical protein